MPNAVIPNTVTTLFSKNASTAFPLLLFVIRRRICSFNYSSTLTAVSAQVLTVVLLHSRYKATHPTYLRQAHVAKVTFQFVNLNGSTRNNLIMAALPPSVARSLEQTKVEYRFVGNSGLRVSVPIIGCMSIGNPEWASWVIGPEKALPLLKAAYDRGATTVIPLPPETKSRC